MKNIKFLTTEVTELRKRILKKTFFLCLCVSVINFFCVTMVDAQGVYLETSKGETRKIPVAVVVGSDNVSMASTVSKVIEADMTRSMYFDLIKNNGIKINGIPSKLDETVRKQIKAMGIESVIVASITQNDRIFKLDGKVYETGSGELIFAKRYTGIDTLIRRVVHRFSDEIVFRLTGEKGIAQTRIVYVSDQTGNKELYIMDYDGYSSRMITGNKSINLSPSWSRDGLRIAYTSYKDGNPDIYVVDLTTSKRDKLTTHPGMDISPSWSPDGSLIAFASSMDGNAEIYTMNKEGEDFKRLTYNNGEDVSPSWSPTGGEIAFTSDRGGSPQIYIMKADGTNQHRLTFKGEYNSDPAWSPKGDKIAFACRRNGGFRICTINPDGGGLTEITNGKGSDESPSWAPDGRRLIFSSSRGGKWNVYMINDDGSNLERLTNNGFNNWGPDWSSN